MRRFAILAMGAVILVHGLARPGTAQTMMGDPEAGRRKAGMCRTCHGIDGRARIPIAPHIGGERADYIARQLIAFRDGTRVHEMMSVVAKGLDDRAIADLSAWYAGRKISASLPPGKDEAGAPEACVACHGANGLAQVEDAPHLAGENAIYIDTQLKAFRSGKRTHEIMSAIAADMTDSDIRAVANWYAGTRVEIEPVK